MDKVLNELSRKVGYWWYGKADEEWHFTKGSEKNDEMWLTPYDRAVLKNKRFYDYPRVQEKVRLISRYEMTKKFNKKFPTFYLSGSLDESLPAFIEMEEDNVWYGVHDEDDSFHKIKSLVYLHTFNSLNDFNNSEKSFKVDSIFNHFHILHLLDTGKLYLLKRDDMSVVREIAL